MLDKKVQMEILDEIESTSSRRNGNSPFAVDLSDPERKENYEFLNQQKYINRLYDHEQHQSIGLSNYGKTYLLQLHEHFDRLEWEATQKRLLVKTFWIAFATFVATLLGAAFTLLAFLWH